MALSLFLAMAPSVKKLLALHERALVSLFISTSGTNARPKTGLQDTYVILDTQSMLYLPKFVSVLATGTHSKTKPWSFLHPSLYHEVKHSAKRLRLEDRVTRHQTRHSRPSIDRAGKFRTLDEVRQRGAWTSMSSVLRYDKSSKLATDDHAIPASARVVIEHTACRLVVCLFGHRSECVEIAASRSSVLLFCV